MQASQTLKVTVVIDVFRSFTTACYVLDSRPSSYKLAESCSVISRLAKQILNPVLIGKPEIGSQVIYNIPNSPTQVIKHGVAGQHVLHRAVAGAKGVLRSKDADLILVAGFVNAEATANYISKLNNLVFTIMPMGHEGITPSIEDDLCASYIKALIEGKTIYLQPYIPQLKEGPGKYFFGEDQSQYPSRDFDLCLETDRFKFAVQAIVEGEYATLKKVGEAVEGEAIFENRSNKGANA